MNCKRKPPPHSVILPSLFLRSLRSFRLSVYVSSRPSALSTNNIPIGTCSPPPSPPHYFQRNEEKKGGGKARKEAKEEQYNARAWAALTTVSFPNDLSRVPLLFPSFLPGFLCPFLPPFLPPSLPSFCPSFLCFFTFRPYGTRR